ncbi:MAG: hypothetical protein FVQ80_09555 [Planctomycetes bacterium]|nr:hypothetical protein [Planctomycetota bacterium]
MNAKELEKYTSAITLSDMEVFVFPELMYSLVMANIMSPIIWKWRDVDCFKKLEGKTSYKKLMRLKQFIMDEFEFNLDLETWGLTDKDKELKRFEPFISPDDIAASNALFGYHGDQYYFDVDIRRHFGLDKYDDNLIPYWKTETVEAMDAFRHRKGYEKAAGECVSLSALYAAAAFVVCRIPLEDIFMILTPLHSQNYLDINNGVLTNNRRLVTKTMWFNGTAISIKAQRAIRNEQVTIITHNTGFVHCFYNDATMDTEAYNRFTQKLGGYLSTDITTLTLANFLRSHPKYQKYFQFCCEQCRGGQKFAKAEVLFHYEHDSNFRIADDTFERLLDEVSNEDILPYKLVDRICVRQLCSFVDYEGINIKQTDDKKAFKKYLAPFIPNVDDFMNDLLNFMYITPKLPGSDKNFIKTEPIKISTEQTREQVIDYLQTIRRQNITADLAFYAFRDMETCDWQPFVKAAIQRNPVSLEMANTASVQDAYQRLNTMAENSIYDGSRLAQPDEVVNFETGDGLEKAFVLANIILTKEPNQEVIIKVDNEKVELDAGKKYYFSSKKGFKKQIQIAGAEAVCIVQ